MRFLGLRYFLAVCEHGSFEAAARNLRVSRSAVIHAVGRLERSLGGHLFVRTRAGRTPRLTALGEEMKPALEELQAARRRLARLIDDQVKWPRTPGTLGRRRVAARRQGQRCPKDPRGRR